MVINFSKFLMNDLFKNLKMTDYEDKVVEKAIISISKFHHMAEKLKLLNHNSFSMTITITVVILPQGNLSCSDWLMAFE